ncbi:hypothetical protein AAC387_Pa12g1911 [Persea americana]
MEEKEAKMSEPEGEEDPTVHPNLQKHPSIGREITDVDLDLDQSWPFDPNPYASNPSSPLIFSFFCSSPSQYPNFQHLPFSSSSSSDRQSSPLWGFSDAEEEKPADSPLDGRFRLPDTSATTDYPAVHSLLGNHMEDDGGGKLPPAPLVEDESSDISCVLKERMMQALRYFKESTKQHVLVQVWAPIKNGDHYVLTTSGQPFVLDPHSIGLLKYRSVSLTYVFSVDGESDSDLGLPGRVFQQKLPEWTPNVQFYSCKEFSRLDHALHYNVRGTLALPVFEPSGQSCVGVIELIMTAQKIHYALDVDKVCRALEAVNLKSSEVLDHPSIQICNEGRQAALAEILQILTVVCETHKLPLAQTWVPCRHRSVLANGSGSKKSCTSFDGHCMGKVFMSTSDIAFYIVDANMWGFRDACAEHHLQKEQGVAGRAYSSHRSCFSSDVTQFSKTEYPLVHYARMFGLKSCLAICLQSKHTGSDDYILEFFFPPNCMDSGEQQYLLDSILTTMKQSFQSLKAVSENELQEEKSIEIIEKSMNVKPDLIIPLNQNKSCAVYCAVFPQTETARKVNELGFNNLLEGEVLLDLLEKQLIGEDEPMDDNELINVDGSLSGVPSPENKRLKMSERKRGKAEKSISLEVLQQYFAGSLKDAAKSLGVCPTTMKRICRHHGISRWPSRKINKVNRSLSKLRRVIESVQGSEGATQQLGSVPCDLQQKGGRESPTRIKPESGHHGENGETVLEGCSRLSADQELNLDESDLQLELGMGSSRLKSGCTEESTEMPTAQDLYHGTAENGTHMSNPSVSSIREQQFNISGCLGMTTQPTKQPSSPTPCSIWDASITTQPETLMSGLLIEGSGSCKDFKDLFNSIVEGCTDSGGVKPVCTKPDQLQSLPCTSTLPYVSATQDMRSVTIKASYKEDIIRFRLLITSTVLELKMEVSKRLKLEVGTFDIKYLDDDNEWVLLACDADLQECMDISRSSGGHVIRLLVHDLVPNFGSSCGSSGD